jgi:pimeloyl-ACP methyl ester carboxylesterase
MYGSSRVRKAVLFGAIPPFVLKTDDNPEGVDFRADLPKIDVPMLVMHGTGGRILPFESTAKRPPALVKNLKLIPVEGGPHNIGWTHPDEVNKGLLEFLSDDTGGGARLDRDLAAATRSAA